MIQQGLSDFHKLILVLDLMRDLSKAQVILKHLLHGCWGIEAEVAEDRATFVEALVTHCCLLANSLPFLVTIDEWLAKLPPTLSYVDVIHLNVCLFKVFHRIALRKHEVFAIAHEKEVMSPWTAEKVHFLQVVII